MDVSGPANRHAVCSAHQLMANGVCARCGAFICVRCTADSNDPSRCAACAPRAVATLAHHPLVSIWLEPRTLMRWALDVRRIWMPDVLLLAAATGIAWRIQWFAIQSSGRGWATLQHRPADVIAGAVLPGVIYGLVNVFVLGWVVYKLGRKFGGSGDARSVQLAVAWGAAPSVWLVPLWLVSSGLGRSPLQHSLIVTVAVALGVWSFVIAVKCVAEAIRRSFWEAFGAYFIANLICCGGPIAFFVGFYQLFNR